MEGALYFYNRMAAPYLIYNGERYSSGALLISPENRSFRYGNGFFETMKMINGNIVLEALHMQRLFQSLQVMQFCKPNYFTPAYIQEQIQTLTLQNDHQSLARVRLMVFRGNGNLYDDDNTPNYLIESLRLYEFPVYGEKGLVIDMYKEGRKVTDAFSVIKNNNYLPYAMAARWSKKTGLDDALVMNNYERIVEATTANVFIVKDGVVQTPPLSEGCIAGVVRRYLLAFMKERNWMYKEKPLTPEEVLDADEVFITNAGFYIRWVQQCGSKIYTNALSKKLFEAAIAPLVRT